MTARAATSPKIKGSFAVKKYVELVRNGELNVRQEIC